MNFGGSKCIILKSCKKIQKSFDKILVEVSEILVPEQFARYGRLKKTCNRKVSPAINPIGIDFWREDFEHDSGIV
jgi:hypothetical protein